MLQFAKWNDWKSMCRKFNSGTNHH